jgi:hypothetical protein
MRRFGLVLALASAACVRTPAIFGADPLFTNAEQEAIWLAAQDWNRHTDADHKISLDLQTWPWLILKRAPVRDEMAGHCLRRIGERGYIELRPDLTLGKLHVATRHEFGHTLGMEHVHRGWMQSTIDEDVEWSFEDEVECRRVGACA